MTRLRPWILFPSLIATWLVATDSFQCKWLPARRNPAFLLLKDSERGQQQQQVSKETLDKLLMDVPRPTENGGYTHTSASRAKISAANRGKTPWNKGRSRSAEVKAKIAEGVRKRNRERFLQKLAEQGMTEEEYEAKLEEEKRQKELEKQARRTEKGGYRPTEETKQKISQVLKEKYAKGEISTRTMDPDKVRRGFTHSEETRRKISESLRKRWQDPKYRANMVNKATEVNTSPEVRQKIAESLKKKWQDPEFKAEMLSKFANRKKTTTVDLDHREKISLAMKEKWQDEEYRKKTLGSIAKRRKAAAPKARPKPAPRVNPKPKRVVTDSDNNDDAVVLKVVEPLTTAHAKGIEPLTEPRVVTSKTTATKKKKKTKKVAASSSPSKSKRTSRKRDDNGSVDLLKEERRDLYDLLYGDEDKVLSGLSFEDENLDNFDPYGLEDH